MSVDQVRNVIKWWEDQVCPHCGGEIKTNAQWCGNCNEWHPKEGNEAYSFCTKCGFKRSLHHDRLPDSEYLEEIKNIVGGDLKK